MLPPKNGLWTGHQDRPSYTVRPVSVASQHATSPAPPSIVAPQMETAGSLKAEHMHDALSLDGLKSNGSAGADRYLVPFFDTDSDIPVSGATKTNGYLTAYASSGRPKFGNGVKLSHGISHTVDRTETASNPSAAKVNGCSGGAIRRLEPYFDGSSSDTFVENHRRGAASVNGDLYDMQNSYSRQPVASAKWTNGGTARVDSAKPSDNRYQRTNRPFYRYTSGPVYKHTNSLPDDNGLSVPSFFRRWIPEVRSRRCELAPKGRSESAAFDHVDLGTPAIGKSVVHFPNGDTNVGDPVLMKSFSKVSSRCSMKDSSISTSADERPVEYVVRIPKLTSSETQASVEPEDDWDWYPWRSDSLLYPVNLKSGASFPVYAGAMIDLKCLCLIRDEDGSFRTACKAVSDEMAEFDESGRLLEFSSIPPEDAVVCAWDAQFSQWSRGLVLERYCEKALIFFLDHGTCADLELKAIRQMKRSWMQVPRNALCVELEDVPLPVSGFFSDEAICQGETLLMEMGIQGAFAISKACGGHFVGKFCLEDGRSIQEVYQSRGIG